MKYLIPFLLLLFVGCGYKPASHFSKQVLGEHIYVDTKIDLKYPENLVLIQDAMNRAVVNRFHSKISNPENASVIVNVKLKDIDFEPLSYDQYGYVSVYRANVTLDFDIQGPNITDTYKGEGKYDFPIEANAVISDSKRSDAIQFASENAIDGFIAFASIKGYMTHGQP